jgi:hypothetical protein
MSIEDAAPMLEVAGLMTPGIKDCMAKRQAILDKWNADWEAKMELEFGPEWRSILRSKMEDFDE